MSTKAGALLWNRKSLVLAAGANDVDTGLTQLNTGFSNSSVNEPGFGTPSRIQVMPLAPTASWSQITHSEPVFNTTTKTIHVVFTVAGQEGTTVNVLFWDPHTAVGPGNAHIYAIIS